MKNVAIVTCIGKSNFGNRLQNYALQKVIEDLGYNAETLKNISYLNNIDNYEDNYKEYLEYKVEKDKRDYANRFRIAYFEEFDKNVKFRDGMVTIFDLKDTGYDYYVVGSDQVWNPHHGRLKDLDLLVEIDDSKRISYAASIGIDELPESVKIKAKNQWLKFKAISVREDRGKEIIEELTGRKDVVVSLDPTMLLTSEEWSRLARRPKQLKTDKYILNYFLGELSEQRKNEIERVAKENDCEIINILDKNGPFYETGPSEFLYLEQNAFLICTDSFHSSVFSILFNRPFIVFDREDINKSMNSRIDTLINTFKLINRNYESRITSDNLNHNYSEAFEILDSKRKEAIMYLRSVLDIKN